MNHKTLTFQFFPCALRMSRLASMRLLQKKAREEPLPHKDDWTLRALCRGNHAYLFFPPSTFERKDDRERRELKAKAICGVCPVQEPCSSHALDIREPFGIWGGLTEGERKTLTAAS